jgi:CRISPR-associated protein Csc3
MIQQTLLRRAVAGRDPALVDMVEALAPAMLLHFAAVPALGGSGRPAALADPDLPAGLPRLTPEALARFSQIHDQSLVTHILNGLFAGLRLAERLPEDRALTGTEKRLWVMGYIVHDYTKVYGIQVEASDVATIRQVIDRLGEMLGFDGYLANWRDYLDDVVFLAQNTQTVAGANLNLRAFSGMRTHARRLELLRLLSSCADILVHMSSPADVAERGADDRDRATNLRTKLTVLFGAGGAPRLVYHRLTEVRGLLSNLINNTAMAQLEAQGCEPYLYFPNGIVYLLGPEDDPHLDSQGLAASVWQRLAGTVANSDGFGVRRAGTGLLFSSALIELVGLPGVLEAGRRAAMKINKGHAPARLYGYHTGQSNSDVQKRSGDADAVEKLQVDYVAATGLPADVRVDRLGEYLTFAYRAIPAALKKAPDIAPLLLQMLKLDGTVTVEQATRQKGGTYFGWFYAAAIYMQKHVGIDDQQLDDVARDLTSRLVAWTQEQGLASRASSDIEEGIRGYVTSHVESDLLAARTEGSPAYFAAELDQYVSSKEAGRPVCSLCSSGGAGVLQEATEVPFINQQYSNKNLLAGGKVIRGVCLVCRMEMILRRVQQPTLSEGDRPILLYLYPTYFFTPETAWAVRVYLDELEDMSIPELLSYLRQNGYDVGHLTDYEGFKGKGKGHSFGVVRTQYSEHDAAGVFSFALRPLGRKVSDTDAWVLPALYALALPLMLGVKVVATPSFVPVYGTGADFRETTVLDAPHGFVRQALGRDRFRLDECGAYAMRLLALYDLHLSVFAEPTDYHWAQINAVAKDVATDPLSVFTYYERKARNDKKQRKGKKGGAASGGHGIPVWDLERYIGIYMRMGGEAQMGIIGAVVDAYAQFYQAQLGKTDAAHAVLRPLMTAIETTVDSDPGTAPEDLALLIAGAVNDDQERVRGGQADGYDPIVFSKALGSYPERLELSRQKIAAFAQLFIDQVFIGHCHGDRAVLRERTNRIRSAARFYYLQNYGRKSA